MQARAGGAVGGGRAGLRALLRATQETRAYRPSGSADGAWAAAARRAGLPA